MEYNEEIDLFISELDMPVPIKALIKSIKGHVFVTLNTSLDSVQRGEAIKAAANYKNSVIVKEMPVILHSY